MGYTGIATLDLILLLLCYTSGYRLWVKRFMRHQGLPSPQWNPLAVLLKPGAGRLKGTSSESCGEIKQNKGGKITYVQKTTVEGSEPVVKTCQNLLYLSAGNMAMFVFLFNLSSFTVF